MTCSVCRANPKGLRDWLLKVFADGDTEAPLYPVALQYAQWGAARVVRGESVAFPTLRNRPGGIDPFDAFRAAMEITRDHGLEWAVTIRDLPGPKWETVTLNVGRELDGPIFDEPALVPSSQLAKDVAARFGCDERTAVAAIERMVRYSAALEGDFLRNLCLLHGTELAARITRKN
jgi:hypothetical protein